MSRKWDQNGVPNGVQNEIATLRHFLPRRHFLSFVFFAFCAFLNCFFCIFLYLEALLGGLWTQKRVKTFGFLRFLKRLFEAPNGSFGLILALLGRSDPKMGSKMSFNIFLKSGKKMCNK